MNISAISTLHNQIFTSKPRKANVKPVTEPPFDIASFNAKGEGKPPEKIVLTKLEEQYNEVLLKLQRLERDIKIQKQNLRDFYSTQDKYDYQELLKESRRLKAQLRRIFQKTGAKDQIEFEIDILQKKQYNLYAAKILKAKSPEELKKILSSIRPNSLFIEVAKLLDKLFSTKVFK